MSKLFCIVSRYRKSFLILGIVVIVNEKALWKHSLFVFWKFFFAIRGMSITKIFFVFSKNCVRVGRVSRILGVRVFESFWYVQREINYFCLFCLTVPKNFVEGWFPSVFCKICPSQAKRCRKKSYREGCSLRRKSGSIRNLEKRVTKKVTLIVGPYSF